MIVTHDMREAFALADRIGVLDAGRLHRVRSAAGAVGSADPRVRDLLRRVPSRRVRAADRAHDHGCLRSGRRIAPSSARAARPST